MRIDCRSPFPIAQSFYTALAILYAPVAVPRSRDSGTAFGCQQLTGVEAVVDDYNAPPVVFLAADARRCQHPSANRNPTNELEKWEIGTTSRSKTWMRVARAPLIHIAHGAGPWCVFHL